METDSKIPVGFRLDAVNVLSFHVGSGSLKFRTSELKRSLVITQANPSISQLTQLKPL